MSKHRGRLMDAFASGLSAVIAVICLSVTALAGWPKLTVAERQFTAPPQAPGAAVVILDKQVYCDNSHNLVQRFFRLKILRSSGMKWATVKVPYVQSGMTVSEIAGRTIEPDGTIMQFKGKVHRSVVVRQGNLRIKALEFNLPQARIGSILDYRYTVGLNGGGTEDVGSILIETVVLPNTTWHLQGKLFVRREEYTLVPNRNYNFRMLAIGLLPKQQPQRKGMEYRLALKNVPPLTSEPFTPPRELIRKSVHFIYSTRPFGFSSAKSYWKRVDKNYDKSARHFIGKPKKLRKWLAGLNLMGTPEQKLQVIYDRIMRIQNLDLDATVASPRANHSVKDVLKHGYGYGSQINLALVGLARAAGIPAWWVHSGRRDGLYFIKDWPESDQLNNDLVMAQAGGKLVFLDPSGGCPYGVLLWFEDGVPALIVNRKGGNFVHIPFQLPHQAMRRRWLDLRWQSKAWQGRLKVSYRGLLALRLRQAWQERDAAGRQKALTRLARSWLPAGAHLSLLALHGWAANAPALSASWRVTVVTSGPSMFLPQDLLNGHKSSLIAAVHRVEPVYFHYPYVHQDTIRVHLPAGAQVGSLPPPTIIPNPPSVKSAVRFVEQSSLSRGAHGPVLEVQRRLRLNMLVVPVKYYPQLRSFFAAVEQSDRAPLLIRSQSVDATR